MATITQLPLRAEVSFQALGRAWTFRLRMAELCALQTFWKIPVDKGDLFWERLRTGVSPQGLTDIYRVGCEKHQPGMTEETAQEIVDELGLERAAGMLAQALRWTMPEPDEGSGPKAKPRGTGGKS